VTVRIDKETKKRMADRKGVNWSEVVRRAIASELDSEGTNRALAVLLNQENVVAPDEGYSSTRTIREWRQRQRG